MIHSDCMSYCCISVYFRTIPICMRNNCIQVYSTFCIRYYCTRVHFVILFICCYHLFLWFTITFYMLLPIHMLLPVHVICYYLFMLLPVHVHMTGYYLFYDMLLPFTCYYPFICHHLFIRYAITCSRITCSCYYLFYELPIHMRYFCTKVRFGIAFILCISCTLPISI